MSVKAVEDRIEQRRNELQNLTRLDAELQMMKREIDWMSKLEEQMATRLHRLSLDESAEARIQIVQPTTTYTRHWID